MAILFPITLDPQMRGDPFGYSSVLSGDWVESMFPGGFLWTLRARKPPSTTVTDTDAIDQASSDDGEIVFADDTHFTIALPSPRTTTWPSKTCFWDLQGKISDDAKHTLAWGTIIVMADMTRS